jgi:streptomycin 6-kinase
VELIVPDGFADDVAGRLGEDGSSWVAGLPAKVARLGERWGLRVDGTPLAGSVALVVPVTREGEPLMLKLAWPHEEAQYEALALSIWDGRGAVRLVEHDRWALLLERADHTHTLRSAPIAEAVKVAGRLLDELAVPAPAVLRRLSDIAARLVHELPRENAQAGNPVPRRQLHAAIGYCAELGPAARSLLVNEDLHYDNVLRARRAPWLVIDPKPVAGDPEYGVIPLLWNRFRELQGDRAIRARLDALVEVGELDADRALGWTLVRAVDGWLWSLQPPSRPGRFTEACAAIARALNG